MAEDDRRRAALRAELAGLASDLGQAIAWARETGADDVPFDPAPRPPVPRAARPAPPSPRPASPPVQAPPPRRDVPVAARAPRAQTPKTGAEDLAAIRADLGDCRRCKLCEGRTNIVFGVGSPSARLVVVGEGPGFHEDRTGEPFVGRAGQLLTRMLAAIGLRRDEVYIANVVKCRPPENRDPQPDEIAACSPFLVRQLEAIAPDLIVTVGRFSSQVICGLDVSIGRLRGTVRSFRGVPVVVTYHPAYLLRNPAAKRQAWEDLLVARAVLRGDRAAT